MYASLWRNARMVLATHPFRRWRVFALGGTPAHPRSGARTRRSPLRIHGCAHKALRAHVEGVVVLAAQARPWNAFTFSSGDTFLFPRRRSEPSNETNPSTSSCSRVFGHAHLHHAL